MSRSVASGNVPPYNLNSLRNSQTHLNRGGHTAAQSSPLRGECDLWDAFRAVRTEHTQLLIQALLLGLWTSCSQGAQTVTKTISEALSVLRVTKTEMTRV